GILSVEMQKPNQQLLEAIKADQAVIRNENEYDYVDNDPDVIEVLPENGDEYEEDKSLFEGTPFEE
ncbi:hypothetical protein, partial [Tepidimicrobium xylanilyticum]